VEPERRDGLHAALQELCVRYGYCIPPDRAAEIEAAPPATADAFVDAVLVAEGLEPWLIDKRTRRELRAVVTRFVEFG